MMEYRWLLPFTYGVDHRALETAVCLADAGGATLVPVALISVSSGRRSSGTRLEHIQQAKDFLVLVQSIAARYHVLVECHEVFTGAVNRCIRMLVQDLRCDSVVAVTGADQTLLLQKQELSDLLTKPPAALVLACLPACQQRKQQFHLAKRFLSWFRQRWRPQGNIRQEQQMGLDDKPSLVRIPEYCSE
ncbi:MAG TPA: hypothetical protein VN207_08995 [Ktedonobacteraceae bacterium]|nr:hypothetical protein [Ktedonobacteraceae bacterium]